MLNEITIIIHKLFLVENIFDISTGAFWGWNLAQISHGLKSYTIKEKKNLTVLENTFIWPWNAMHE